MGIDLDRIIELNTRYKTHASAQAFIEELISNSQSQMQDELHVYTVVRRERHLGTGEADVFALGPQDSKSYVHYSPAGCLVDVVNVFLGGDCDAHRTLQPYPTDCELGTDDYTEWMGTATLTNSTTRKAGSYSVSAVFANTVQYARYPDTVTNAEWVDKNIDAYGWMAFYVRSSVVNVTVTVRLFNADGDYNEASYKIVKASHWYLVMLDLDEDFTSTVDWDDDNLMYVEFRVDTACTLLIDNMNFNDGWMCTAPAGEVAIMHRISENEDPIGRNYPFYVDYRFDPYLVSTPANIKKACSCLAGIDLIDFLRGVRQADTGFEGQGSSGMPVPDREALVTTRRELKMKYDEAVNSVGYGIEFPVIQGE